MTTPRTSTVITATVPAGDLRAAISAATLAPSLHNSQPWAFAINADGIDIFADRTRSPRVVDPTDRELHIGCGAATFFARLALRSLGWDVRTELTPNRDERDHLARLTVVGAREQTQEERLLMAALPIRYTDRGRYADQAIPGGFVEEFRAAVESEGAWLRPLDRPTDGPAVATILAHADEIERADPAYLAELERWSRFDNAADDGVPRAAVDSTPVAARASNYKLRDFDVDGSVTAGYHGGDEPPMAERPLVVVLGTDGDDAAAWLRAGMALAKLLLQATVRGVSAAPMTQPLEIPAARLQLGRAIGVLGHPQMLLRMGYGTGRPTTHRRSVDDVLR
jgi:nitroreductase